LVQDAAEPLREALVDFVRDNNISGLIWEQYTPYFNDGEACIFSVGEPALILRNPEAVFSSYDEENCVPELSYSDWDRIMGPDEPGWYEHVKNLIEETGLTKGTFETAQSFVQQLMGMEDVLKQAFGDHVHVKVTAEGVDVDEYNHG
jgi:hypothetical protein